ncbi:UbiA family prenyltransferase [Aureivirga marina]|uniref:UbiA family prenyltransferase n=1 Tax=Aureivirga marina TaxID=1182451 RepID=UPI0018CA7134|nr:UbiA family prenyltransferase [Aureivirga marina]
MARSIVLTFFDTPKFILNELKLLWNFTKRDLLLGVFSTSIFMSAAVFYDFENANLSNFFIGILYFSLYIYSNAILSQIYKNEEEKITLPSLPTSIRKITKEEAWQRYIVFSLIFIFLGWHLKILSWTALWILVTFWINAKGGDKHWFTKNIIAKGLGTITQLIPAWLIIQNDTSPLIYWAFIISIWVAFTSVLDDFRNIKVDSENERKTLPIIYGEKKAKYITTAFWTIMMFSVCFTMYNLNTDPNNIKFILLFTVIAVLHLFIITRILIVKNIEKHRVTFYLQCALYCVLLLGAFLV